MRDRTPSTSSHGPGDADGRIANSAPTATQWLKNYMTMHLFLTHAPVDAREDDMGKVEMP
jgi:hypothetical protein